MASTVVVLDNGAHTAKVGLANQEEPRVVPNCIMKAKSERRRAFVGNQIEDCRDTSALFYILAFQRGYLLNWDTQKTVWDYIFSKEGIGCSLDNRNIVITEPQMNFPSVQEAMLEMLFEQYRVAGMYKTTAADLAAFNYVADSEERTTMQTLNCIIIDVGYSFTHIVPFVLGRRVLEGIRRIDMGGKALTNHLKELISYRQLNMMDESHVVNQIKEDVCFVAEDFKEAMRVHQCEKKRKEVAIDYVLPDFTTIKRGYVRIPGRPRMDEETMQTVPLCNERFTVPELLFNPSDIGIHQVGIPEAVADCLKACPWQAHRELLLNILIVGGCAQFPGFLPRLKKDLRALVPDDLEVSLICPEDPVRYAWYGGREVATSPNFEEFVYTRDDYEEFGVHGLNQR
ncbi:GL16521 [Drosophila persimilis]|uniref:Actin-related protein 6 n=3 Tax=pseudoobscura subgroup TaxID=32358 RepID=Q29IB2_DROPS|nr:actin-related protein 6 [Drosophila pseudoobscura]XP_002022879.1 actin-related protein 6 isoform X1 [Drosophila persimilis]EDW26984.1 GL16521 [Drosophila persimilis]